MLCKAREHHNEMAIWPFAISTKSSGCCVGVSYLFFFVPAAPDSPLHQYLDNIAGLAWARPGHFLLVLGLIVAAAGLLALQLWIIVTPLSPHVAPVPLLLRQAAGGDAQQQQCCGWEEANDEVAAAAAAAASKAAAGKSNKEVWGSADKAAADWPGLVAGSGRVGRPVVVGWNVPGVREWLLGAQQAGSSPAEEAAVLLEPGPSSRDETVSGVIEACLSALLALLILPFPSSCFVPALLLCKQHLMAPPICICRCVCCCLLPGWLAARHPAGSAQPHSSASAARHTAEPVQLPPAA
jgi:hypothetical protein